MKIANWTHIPMILGTAVAWLRFRSIHGQVPTSLRIPNKDLASLALNEVASGYSWAGWQFSRHHATLFPGPLAHWTSSHTRAFHRLSSHTPPSALSSFITSSQKLFLIPTSTPLCGISYICHFASSAWLTLTFFTTLKTSWGHVYSYSDVSRWLLLWQVLIFLLLDYEEEVGVRWGP